MTRVNVRELLQVGDPSQVTPTDVILGPVLRRGVRRQHVVLVHADGSTVPCYLLAPDREPPWPAGVVAVHQHDNEFAYGKSEVSGLVGNSGLAYGERLARMGLAVVAPDLSGFEERRGATTDDLKHEQSVAWQLVAQGETLQGRHVRDVALATSWLQQSGLVSGQLGIVGHSLGGQVAFFAMAVDARLRAGVISCGVGTLASFEEHSVLHNPAWYVPRLRSFGDAPAVSAAFTDQRVMVLAGRSDPLFPWEGVGDVVAGFPEGVCEFRPFDGPHEFPAELLEPSLRWLSEQLS